MRELRRTSGYTKAGEEIEKGPLKIISKEDLLDKKDKQLEKLEEKTNQLLEKAAKKTQVKPPAPHKLALNKPQTPHKTKRTASYFAYLCMPSKKLPKKILDHVKENAFLEAGEWFSKIDSYELKEKTGVDSHQASNTIRQLRDEGFFEIIEHSTSGYRLLKVDPEIYRLNSP